MSKTNFKKMYLIAAEKLNALNAMVPANNLLNSTVDQKSKEVEEDKKTNLPINSNNSKDDITSKFGITDNKQYFNSSTLHGEDESTSDNSPKKGVNIKTPFRKILTRKYNFKNKNQSDKKEESTNRKNASKSLTISQTKNSLESPSRKKARYINKVQMSNKRIYKNKWLNL